MKFYTDIAKTPLGVFVDCYVDNNLESLIIEGPVSHETLSEAWNTIQGQFALLMGNYEQRIFITTLKEVNEISAIINQATTLISIMEYAFHPSFGEMLNKTLKLNFVWPERDRPAINALLRRCISHTKPLQMKYEIKSAALKVLEKKMKGTGEKPSRAYFDLLLNLIEEHFSVPVDYNIVTSRFCDKVKRMNDQLRKNKSHAKRK